ncbi:carboxypeptidase regulatory-like domain-containing protein [Nonomuraea sp. K274]|uniref:Carboxypeptidase regulatory-like domain-containing protein n=1 Tax=Nonomuraea cypriaca TaxID=1187855 RepID=A0A931ABI8_9ACTN|nr:carboxypeptidase regulatory-like domain-containing protein [Nonomuraea cypriaca]MBF8188803.1 carboxypeptidase regulatory-like domain-containing protein [Nonomuraea cypriaca]
MITRMMTTAAMVAALALPVLPAPPAAAAQAGTTYYVDATAGDDTASGTDEAHAWKSLTKVSETTFQPGDRILLRAGQRWSGQQLWPKGSGESGAPITVDTYGEGARPRIDAAGQVNDAVRLFNQEFWTIRGLEVTNEVPATGNPGENLRDLRGIHVSGDNSQTLDGFVVDGVAVHDVTGQVNWIGGSVEDNEPGVRFQTGWDGSKKTGGIVFDTTVPDVHAPPEQATVLNDVLIQNSTVANTSFAGIVLKQYTGDGKNDAGETIAEPTGWGTRESRDDPKFTPHTNIVIRNNHITQAGTAYGCNGMYLTNVRGALVERNVVYRTGTSGIESYYSDDVTFQFNEVYETQQKAGGADSNGIDPDKGTTRHVIQYNYLHDNGDGVLLCQFAFGDAVVRNNVITGNSRYQIYLHSDKAATAQIYNNTIYNDKSEYLIYGYGSYLEARYDITGNLLHSTKAGAVLSTSPTIAYSHNLYGGATLTVPPGDEDAVVTAAPLFADAPLDGPYGTPETGPALETAYGLRVTSGSYAIDTGTEITGNGGRDYAGTPLYNGAPDLGAFEYVTPDGATTESVTGTVRSPSGAPISGVAVTAGGGMATTGQDGRFAIRNLPFADGVEVTATRNGYATATGTADVRPGNVTTVHLTMTSTSTVGSITGRVLDQAARPLPGAAVTVEDGDQTLATATSGADGAFTAENVPVGEGYTLRAAADGFGAKTRTGMNVEAATATDAGSLLLVRPMPDYVAVHDFEHLPTGPLSGGDGLVVSGAGGGVEVVETTRGRNVRLTRTRNSGVTSLTQAFALKGIVTVETNVMSEQPYTSGNHWWSIPYVKDASGLNAVSLAFTKDTIVAYAGTTTKTVGAYEPGRWYHVAAVLDTVNKRFDLLIDGRRVLEGAGFRAAADTVELIDYSATSSNYGTIDLDDIRVSQGVGLARDEAGLLSLDTSEGTSADGVLEVPARVSEVTVTAVARSPFARSVAIDGERADGAQATRRVALGETGAEVRVVVTAEDGTEAAHSLRIKRSPLAQDTTLSALVPGAGTLDPAFDPDVRAYTLTITGDQRPRERPARRHLRRHHEPLVRRQRERLHPVRERQGDRQARPDPADPRRSEGHRPRHRTPRRLLRLHRRAAEPGRPYRHHVRHGPGDRRRPWQAHAQQRQLGRGRRPHRAHEHVVGHQRHRVPPLRERRPRRHPGAGGRHPGRPARRHRRDRTPGRHVHVRRRAGEPRGRDEERPLEGRGDPVSPMAQ